MGNVEAASTPRLDNVAASALTSALMLTLATAVCYGIERPAMTAIRRKYKLSRAHPPRPAVS